MKHFAALIQRCEDEIRAGHMAEVKHLMARLNLTRVPREFRQPLARICRRIGYYSIGLRLLARIINSPKHTGFDAAPIEVAEYGSLLLRSGAVKEGLQRLEGLDPKIVPEAALFSAYGHFLRWEYRLAVPSLQFYVSSPVSDYARAVGRANLSFAQVELREHGEALKTIDENIIWLEGNNHSQLLSSCYALRAQVYMQENQLGLARKELNKAIKVRDQNLSNDQFLVIKLDLLLRALESGSLEPLEELRARAVKARDWEALREADLYSLKVKFENVRFLHLFFGTSYPEFRERIETEFGPVGNRTAYVLGRKDVPRFDIMTGELERCPILIPGSRGHQLIEVLLRDFYQPQRIASLFSEIFPDERFDIDSSPARVHQIIRRTRRVFEKQRLPAEIMESDGFYSLQTSGPLSFRLPLIRSSVDHMNLHFNQLNLHFRACGNFSAHEVRERLKLSKTSVFRLLSWAIEAGKIERLGETGRAAKYRMQKKAA